MTKRSHTLTRIVLAANIAQTIPEVVAYREIKLRKNYKTVIQKGDYVRLQKCSFSRGFKCIDLTGKISVVSVSNRACGLVTAVEGSRT